VTLQEFIEKAKAKQAEKKQPNPEVIKTFIEKLKAKIPPKKSSETPLE
jgi:hypothetical protein